MKGKIITWDRVFLFFIFCVVTATILLLLIIYFYPYDCTAEIENALMGCICPPR